MAPFGSSVDITALISSTARMKLEDEGFKSEIELTARTNDGPSVKDIIEAYAYHKVLEKIINGEEPNDWSDSDDYASTLDEDESQIELSEEEEGDEEEEEVQEEKSREEVVQTRNVKPQPSSKNKKRVESEEEDDDDEDDKNTQDEDEDGDEESDHKSAEQKQVQRTFEKVEKMSKSAFSKFSKKMGGKIEAPDDMKKAFSKMKGAFSKFGRKKKEETESEEEENEDDEDESDEDSDDDKPQRGTQRNINTKQSSNARGAPKKGQRQESDTSDDTGDSDGSENSDEGSDDDDSNNSEDEGPKHKNSKESSNTKSKAAYANKNLELESKTKKAAGKNVERQSKINNDEDDEEENDQYEDDDAEDEKDEDEEDDEPSEPLYLLQSTDELTVPTRDNERNCPNAQLRSRMWMSDPNLEFPDEMGFFTRVGNVCIQARVRECHNKTCKEKRAEMEGNAPACAWSPFRTWAIAAMSCQAAMTKEQKLSVAHTHLARAIGCLAAVLRDLLDEYCELHPTLDGAESSNDKLDIAGALNLIYWMMNVQSVAGTGTENFGRWDQRLVPPEVTMPSISKSVRKLESLHICKNRMWCLLNLSDRKDGDLPDIVATMANSAASFRHEGHDACTPSKCNYTFLNTTQIDQLHKCVEPGRGRRVCNQEKKFPVEILETALELGRGTAWSTIETRLCRENEPYIAISHVWADGTGIGLKEPGTVNRCLFGYFASIADRLGCKGMWWDSLSIPTEPNARSKALNRMNASYKDAKYTVVHDSYLLNFEWKNDGSPCLAIVFSAWFTRGWTALELAMSERVVVLYKGADDDTPLIKDLDRDILAHDPSTCSRAHWLASSLIRRLRQRVANVPDLLTVLRPRFTTKAKDRAEIAGLLAGIRDLNYNRFEGEITKDILRFFGSIPYSCLMHGKPTLRDSGPFSWCATSLEDMPIDLTKDMESREEGGLIIEDEGFLEVSLSGAVKNWWDYIKVTKKHVSRIKTYGDDLSTDVKVKSALLDPKSCLLLWEEYEFDTDTSDVALLVQVVDATGELLECRYVGAVHYHIPENDNADGDDDGEDMWDEYSTEIIRIGNDQGKPVMSVEDALKKMEEAPIEDEDSTTEDEDDADNENDDEDDDDDEMDLDVDEKKTDKSTDNALLLGPNSSQQNPPEPIKVTEAVPWYKSRDDVKKYERPTDASELENESNENSNWEALKLKLSRLSKGDSETLLYALKAKNKYAVRFLIKSGVDLSWQMKKNLKETLGEKKHGELTKMLADVYRDNGKLVDARKMYRYAIYHAGRKPGTRIAEAKHELAKICVGLGKPDEAMKLYQDVLKFCKEKSDIKKQKEDAKQDKQKQKEQQQAKSKQQQQNNPQLRHQRKSSVASVAPGQRQRRGSVASVAPGKGGKKGDKEKEPEKEKTPEQRMGRLERLELSATANLALLFADRGEFFQANQVYSRALKGLGKASDTPDSAEAFTLVPKDRLLEDYKYRNTNIIRREAVYKLAARRFSNDLGDDHPMTLLTAINMGLNYGAQNKKADCEELVRDALQGFRKIYGAEYMKMASFGTEHIIVLCCFSWLAKMLQQEGKTEDAKTIYRHVVSGLSTKLNPDHPLRLINLVELGTCLMVTGEVEQAEGMFLEAIKGFEGPHKDKFGRNHKVTADIYRYLGRANAIQGKVDEADENLRQAISRLEQNKAYSSNHMYYCYALTSLAEFQEQQGDFEEAERNCRKALEGLEKSAGPKHGDTLGVTEMLGRLCERKGSLDEAIKLYARVLEGHDEILGAYNTLTLQACGHLGTLYLKRNMLQLAEEHWRRVYKGYGKSPDADVTRLFAAAYELGKVYKAEWKWRPAENLLQEAYMGLKRTSDLEKTLSAAMDLGEVFLAEDKPDDARETFQSAFEISSKNLGETHLTTSRFMWKIAQAFIKQRSFDQADFILDKLDEKLEDVEDSPEVEILECGILTSQGRIMYKRGNQEEAKSLLEEAVEDSAELSGDKCCFDAKASLSDVLIYTNEPEEALPLLENAVQGYEELNDYAMLDAMDSLARLYRQLGKYDEAARVDGKLRKRYEGMYGAEAANVIMKMCRR